MRVWPLLATGVVFISSAVAFTQTQTGNWPVHRWHNLAMPTNLRADEIITLLNSTATSDADGTGTGDVACPLVPIMQRQGEVQSFTFGDGSLDTQQEVTEVVSRERGAYVVNEINYCGGPPNPGFFIIGCATVGSNGAIAVINRSNRTADARLWLHEYGHTKGLRHSSVAGNVMEDGGNINAAQCRAFQRTNLPLVAQPLQIPEITQTEPIERFVRRTFYEAVPWELARRFKPSAVPFLIRQLRAPAPGVSLPTVVGTLGVIGDPRAVQPLIAFIERGVGQLSQEEYGAKKGALHALGLIAAQAPSPAATTYLARGMDPSFWADRLRWTLPYSTATATRDTQMLKAAIWGNAFSGRPQAGNAFQQLRVRLMTPALANSAAADLPELLVEAEAVWQQVSREGVAQFYLKKR